jgi:hypothetical protein
LLLPLVKLLPLLLLVVFGVLPLTHALKHAELPA